MIMVNGMSMGPIAIAFDLFECDFGWFALAVLIFSSPLDPRLGLVV